MYERGKERKLLVLAFLYALTGGTVLYIKQPGKESLWAIGAAAIIFIGFLLLSFFWQQRKMTVDQYIIPIVSLIISTGVIFLFRLNPGYGYRQLSWVVIGLAVLWITTTLLRRYREIAEYKYLVALAGIIALLLPIFFGIELGGAKSWLDLGFFHFQPSEFVKLLLVFFLASYLMENRMIRQTGEQRVYNISGVGQWGPLLGMWLTALLVLVFQKDLGTALIYFGTFLAMVYMATSRLLYILLGALMFFAGAAVAYMQVEHVHTRVAIWLDPWLTPQTSGYQIIQSLFAIDNGGIWGAGLGAGFPGFIPAVHTDFLFAAICEEAGLLGGVGIMVLYMLLIYRGFKIALAARDEYSSLLAAGFTAILGLQVLIIVAGVTKLLPMTGITLPFISYGGSSMVANFILIGMLLNISGELMYDES